MRYTKGQKVVVKKVAGLRGREAVIEDVTKAPHKPTIYTLKVQGYKWPYHCTSAYIRSA